MLVRQHRSLPQELPPRLLLCPVLTAPPLFPLTPGSSRLTRTAHTCTLFYLRSTLCPLASRPVSCPLPRRLMRLYEPFLPRPSRMALMPGELDSPWGHA